MQIYNMSTCNLTQWPQHHPCKHMLTGGSIIVGSLSTKDLSASVEVDCGMP